MRHAAEARRPDRDVGAGEGDVELLLDDLRRLGLFQPNEALVEPCRLHTFPGCQEDRGIDGS